MWIPQGLYTFGQDNEKKNKKKKNLCKFNNLHKKYWNKLRWNEKDKETLGIVMKYNKL